MNTATKNLLPVTPGSVIRFADQFGVWQLYNSGRWSNTVSGSNDSLDGDTLWEVYGARGYTILTPQLDI